MISWARRIAAAAAAIAASMILFSCSSGPEPPAKGTPAFYWDAAKQTFAGGDYVKALDHLDNIVATDNEYTAKARAWMLVMESGMARGYMEVADYFESGARINKSDPTTFRKQVSQNRGLAGRLALRFADQFGNFQKTKEDPVLLAFPFPTGSLAPVLALTKVGNGILPQLNEVELAQRSAVSRSVVLATCRAAGNPDDAAKTQEMFKAGEVKVPRAVFVMTMAGALHDEAQLFTRNKQDEPDKLKIFCERAQEALKSIPETKETKGLDAKIQATLKKNKT